MIEMTRIDGIIFGTILVVVSSIAFILMAISDIRRYLRHRNKRHSRR